MWPELTNRSATDKNYCHAPQGVFCLRHPNNEVYGPCKVMSWNKTQVQKINGTSLIHNPGERHLPGPIDSLSLSLIEASFTADEPAI